jgi:hypothetical protein
MSNNGLSSHAQPANGDGAAGPRKRKIDRSEWPTLLARRQAGATQAQIAQDYGVSQGTVSQILKRAKAEAECGQFSSGRFRGGERWRDAAPDVDDALAQQRGCIRSGFVGSCPRDRFHAERQCQRRTGQRHQ